jgi:hypothetical protein
LHPATKIPAIEPDLRPSSLPNLPSHSETLKINLERAIAAIGPSSVRGMREVGRLMDWSPQERVRTASYCIAYFTCWVFGYALLGLMSFGVAVICFPSCRRYFFPAVSLVWFQEAVSLTNRYLQHPSHLPLLPTLPTRKGTRACWAMSTSRLFTEVKRNKPKNRLLRQLPSCRHSLPGLSL